MARPRIKGQAEAAAELGPLDPPAAVAGIVLDGQSTVPALSAASMRTSRAAPLSKVRLRRAADRFGDDQPDGNGDVGADLP